METTKATSQMRGTASEHRSQRDAAVERDIHARTRTALAETQHATGMAIDGRVKRHLGPVERRAQVGAGERKARVLFHS